MKIFFLGDIVGKSEELHNKNLKQIIKDKKIDFVVVNGEMLLIKVGITEEISNELFSLE